ncbi:MAG: thiol reductant ABC exporter subunit CydD [Anaerolineales bacterium]|jgi:thiol reductant ABC exporter CydD subunit
MKLNRTLIRQIKPGRLWIAATISLSVLQAGLLVAQAYLISSVINAVFLKDQGLVMLRSELLWLGALAFARLMLNTLTRVSSVRAATNVKLELRTRLIQRLQHLGPVALAGKRSGELVHTAQEGIESLDAYVGEYLPQLALAALTPITILVFIIPLDLISALVLAVTAPLIPVFMVLIGDTAADISRRQWKSLGDLSARFLDVLQGLSTLKLFGRSKSQIDRLRALGETYRLATMRVLRVAFLSALVLELVATISTAIVAVQVGLRLLYGQLEFQQAFFVLILAPEFYLPLRTLGAKFHAGISGAVALESMLSVGHRQQEDLEPEPADFQNQISHPARIEFDHVQVRFPQREGSGLTSFTLTLEPGACTALIGPTGAGKSTVAHLLLRFLKPERGRILVNGTPLHQIPPDTWRRHVAWVPQHPYLFNMSVLENLSLANPEAPYERLEWAARQARAHEFICQLPNGYQTIIGENALQLSAGQAQRIALARAFLKAAPLIILDEATAHLDVKSEAAVTASIKDLITGRTSLLIAHRLDTIVFADQITVMALGSILESGSHAELMLQSGAYRQLQDLYRGAS